MSIRPGREKREKTGALILALAMGLFSSSSTMAGDDPSQVQVEAAIARGVAFLKKEQGGEGGWTYSFNHNHDLGITALASLALLENGVEPTDPAIVKAVGVVRDLAEGSDLTYDLSLAILCLARVQKGQSGRNDAFIRRLAERIANGDDEGMWTYQVPLSRVGGSRRAGLSSRRKRRFVSRLGDNSNTQFALLGIWAAGRHGFDPNDALASIESHFRGTQTSDGRWGYVPGDQGTEAMTCAGLMGLAISAARPALAERQTAHARGAALAADQVFSAALKAVSRDARGVGSHSDIYYLWSLERVCVALGLRDLDGLDWYASGARELLRRQSLDGGWPEEQWGRLPNTCLALLFLRKANLAFELDRVLKLPGVAKPQALIPEESAPAPVAKSEDEVSVIVTGASDARFPEIAVDFEVKTSNGTFINDAKADDFHLTENGVPVPKLRLQPPATREARPITVVLVVDRSRSMEEDDRISMLKRAVATFLKGLPRGSRIAVVAFGSEVEKVCPFTSDFEQVQKAVDGLTAAGATRYYDAVAESLELIKREPGQRAILALTDGEDTFSQAATLDSLIASARTQGLPIHTLGLGSDDEIESDALKRLASSTRGQYYPARQAQQLQAIYEQIATRLRSSYTLIYQTDRKIPDGTLRPVRIVYRSSRQVGETAVFVPGMVVPAPGWPRLFLGLIFALFILAVAPGRLFRSETTPRAGNER